NGMMKKRPGPFSAMSRPSRKTTPRSYSAAMRRLEKSAIRTMTRITAMKISTLASIYLFLLRLAVRHSVFWGDLQLEALPPDDADRRARVNRRGGGGPPKRAPPKD